MLRQPGDADIQKAAKDKTKEYKKEDCEQGHLASAAVYGVGAVFVRVKV
jgi:DNA/RNA endonuclease G (NUC1)